MKALVKYDYGPGNMEIRDVPEPECKKDHVKIKIHQCGICGSDLHIYQSDIAISIKPPVITGHEFSGVIVEVGENVKDFKVGDRVVSEAGDCFCENCDCCNDGYANICPERKSFGYWFNGGFASYAVIPAKRVHKIPDNISLDLAALTEPLACVCHAIYDMCYIRAGDVVLITGPGAIGLMALQIAKAEGATTIITGIDSDETRLKLAKDEFGADYIVNVQKENLQNIIDKATNLRGVDVVLECSGSEAAIDNGLQMIKKRGYFVQIGLPGKKILFDIEKICYKELNFRGAMASRNHSWKKALYMMSSGLIKLEKLVDVKLPLTQWEQAFVRFKNQDGIKFFLIPEND